jgi:hypothetical protein
VVILGILLIHPGAPATPDPTTAPVAIGLYGPGINADNLNNSQIGGPQNQETAYRFRATQSSGLKSIRVYVIGPAKAGYGAGTGGTIRATVETDDGTAVHGPSGVVLATRDFTPTDGAGNVYTFTSSPNLTDGRLYHIRFTNIDGNPAANYISLDGTYQAATVGQWQPLGPNVDFAQVLKIGNNPWTESRGSGTSVITPMLDLTYGDGSHQGMGYIETWGRGGRDGYNTADGSNALREVFTVNGQSLSVSQVSVRLARTSGSGDLSLRLETSGGVGIETVLREIRAAAVRKSALGEAFCPWSGARRTGLGEGRAHAVEERIEAGGHDDGIADDPPVALDQRLDLAALVDDVAAARERIEVAGVEDVPVIGLVEDGDLPRVLLRDHVQDDAADRRDAGVAGDEDDRTLAVVRQQKIAERLSATHDVTVLTTCAADHVTWRNELPVGESLDDGVRDHEARLQCQILREVETVPSGVERNTFLNTFLDTLTQEGSVCGLKP